MPSTAEYVLAYQNQTSSDSADSTALLMEFLASHGLTDAAVDLLCQLIDEEGFSDDFGQHLRENGLIVDPVDDPDEEEPLLDDDAD